MVLKDLNGICLHPYHRVKHALVYHDSDLATLVGTQASLRKYTDTVSCYITDFNFVYLDEKDNSSKLHGLCHGQCELNNYQRSYTLTAMLKYAIIYFYYNK